MMLAGLVALGLGLAAAAPAYGPYYGSGMDTYSFGGDRQGMVMNRYYQPYYPRGGGVAAFMVHQPAAQAPGAWPQAAQAAQAQDYNQPDRRRQAQDAAPPPQQNEVYPQPEDYTRQPETETDAPTTLRPDAFTTLKTEIVEPVEPDVEEVKPKKPAARRNKKPAQEEDDYDEAPRLPAGAFFPMFFGYGGRGAGGAGGAGTPGVVAVANSYSTGRGGVSSSHATAYGGARPDARL